VKRLAVWPRRWKIDENGSIRLSGRITISPKTAKICYRDQRSLSGRASDTYITAQRAQEA
jgi:hypothetical protein